MGLSPTSQEIHALMKCLSVMYLLLSSFDTCFAPGTNRNLGYFGALVRISERFDQKSQLAVLLKLNICVQ